MPEPSAAPSAAGPLHQLPHHSPQPPPRYLDELGAGRSANKPAPAIARQYWQLADGAMLRDVIVALHADEAGQRDDNHGLASQLAAPPMVAAR